MREFLDIFMIIREFLILEIMLEEFFELIRFWFYF